MKRTVSLLSLLLVSAMAIFAQEKSGLDAKSLAKANNPLANMKAFNIHHYWSPSLSAQDANMNTTMFRYAQPLAGGKVLLRATLPTFNGSSADGTQYSGLGGLNLFTTYSFTDASSPVVFGAGPMVTTPNLTSGQMTVNGLEVENPFEDTPWSLGGALVFFSAKNPRLQYGGLVTYEHSLDAVAGKKKDMAIVQPFMMVQLGKGNYLRSAASTQLDFANDKYYVPVGMGVGKVTKIGSTVINFFVEPQYTVYSNYSGASNFTVFGGMNFQFMGGK